MKIKFSLRFIIMALFMGASYNSGSQTLPGNVNSYQNSLAFNKFLNQLVRVKASVAEAPPDWAVMQRHLIRAIQEAAPYYVNKFTGPDGEPYGKGPYDDVYEMFFNWPVFYAITGDSYFYQTALKEYNAITRSNTAYFADSIDYSHQLYNEFPRSDDFFHKSEGLTFFYNLGLGGPAIPENIKRARRFAGLYLNEDPAAPNYSSKDTIIKSIFTGSQGPLIHSDGTYNLRYGHASLFPKVDSLEADWTKNPKRKKEILALYDKIVTRTDVPVNLAATGLMTNAFLYTGDEKYKKWVLDYVDAWMNRIVMNGGLIPDNIGQTGKIGEYRNGQWWGGLYGWYGRYGLMMIFSELSVASENAYMLSGDPKYLNLLRSQIIGLMQRSKTTQEGQMLVPYRYKKGGWYSYRPMMIQDLAHLWHASMADEDWERIETLMKGNKFHPLWDEGMWGENTLQELDNKVWEAAEPFDWSKEMSMGERTFGSSEHARLMYYAGKNPDWPMESLKADYQEVIKTMNFMRNDPRDVSEITADDLYPNNPIITKALVQTTMGTPQTIYNGGMLRATLRYFDADKERPGIPEDVSALVEDLKSDRAVLHLVNLNLTETRRLILQAGAFGEHAFTTISYELLDNSKKDTGSKSQKVEVNGSYFLVDLPPGTSVRLNIGLKRFVNKPSYHFPWSKAPEPLNK